MSPGKVGRMRWGPRCLFVGATLFAVAAAPGCNSSAERFVPRDPPADRREMKSGTAKRADTPPKITFVEVDTAEPCQELVWLGVDQRDAFGYPQRVIDQTRLLAQLRQRRFADLTRQLEGLQHAFERDFREEQAVYDAFAAFNTADPRLGPLLDAWATQSGSSFVPHMAIAEYHHARAWHARGEQTARETGEARLRAMHERFAPAVSAAQRALELNPQLQVAYKLLLSIANARSEDESLWYRRGVAACVITGVTNNAVSTSVPAFTITRSALDGRVTATSLGAVTTTATYDSNSTSPGFGDLTGLSASRGTTPLFSATYTRDKLGRILQRRETVQGMMRERNYDYDNAGRLTHVRNELGDLVAQWDYDANGNRERAWTVEDGARIASCPDGRATNDLDQLCDYGGKSYAYDARGTLHSVTGAEGSTTYTYDAQGLLSRVDLPSGDWVQYVHDAMGRRIGKLKNGAFVKGWLYVDSLRPIAQVGSNGQVEATFVYGIGRVPDYIVQKVGANNVTYRIVADHLGTPRLLVDVASGTIAQRLDVDEFGRVTSDTNPGFQPFGFAGGLYDPDTGLVRFGARDYDAFTGSWTAKDPILLAGGDANLYAYVGSDPMNYIDPTGLARFVFDKSEGKISLYDDAGNLVHESDASNRRSAPSGTDPWKKDGRGPFPNGTFPVLGVDHGNKGQFPHGFFRVGGAAGARRPGIGIHGDGELTCPTRKPAYTCGTLGCIRVPTSDIDWFVNYHNTVETIREITVQD